MTDCQFELLPSAVREGESLRCPEPNCGAMVDRQLGEALSREIEAGTKTRVGQATPHGAKQGRYGECERGHTCRWYVPA